MARVVARAVARAVAVAVVVAAMMAAIAMAGVAAALVGSSGSGSCGRGVVTTVAVPYHDVMTAAVPTTAVAAVVGDNWDNGDNVSGVDGGGDDGGCDDGKCNGGSGGNGDSDGSGEAMKTTAATAMAVRRNTTIN
jgi:hypothetical protein